MISVCRYVRNKLKSIMRMNVSVRMECIELMEFANSVHKEIDTIIMLRCVNRFAQCYRILRIIDVCAMMDTTSLEDNAKHANLTKSMTKGGKHVSSLVETMSFTMGLDVNASMDSIY